MTRIESSTHVQGTPGQVFDFLSAAMNHARFIPNMEKLDQTSSGTFAQVGTRAKGLLSYFGVVKIPVLYEIIEHEPDYRMAMKGVMGPILFKNGYILQEKSAGTVINFWLELTPTGWTKLLSPFMSLIGKIHAWETLRNLKRELGKNGVDTVSIRSAR